MKRILSFSIIAVLLIAMTFSLFSCDRKYDEAVVASEAVRLIEESRSYNDIFWGSGIRYIRDASTGNGAYYEADYLHLSELGFYTVDKLKEKTATVFSAEYCDTIFQTVFQSISDDTEIQFYARYYQKYADAEGKDPVAIMVYSNAENLLPDEVSYHYDTIKVTHSKGERVFVTLDVSVKRGEKTQRKNVEIALREEEDGWKIDSPTYLKYNEKLDEYQDLLDKNK